MREVSVNSAASNLIRRSLDALQSQVLQAGLSGEAIEQLRQHIDAHLERSSTEIERAEEEVQRLRQKLMGTLDHISEGFAAFDREWKFIYVNEMVTRILGKSKEQLIGRAPEECIPDHQSSQFVKQLARAVEKNKPREFEAFCAAMQAWFTCRCYPTAEGAVLFVNDITQRRAAELALRQSEEHFRLLMEGVKDSALFLLDTQGHITSWNAGAQRIKGYTPEEIIGEYFSVCYTPEDARLELPKEHLATAARTGSCAFEGWMVCKNGSRFWAEGLITALHHPDGSLRGFAKITRDMTDRKRAEEAVEEARDRAEAACTIKDQFLAALSHELRTPLTPVLAAISMMANSAARTADESEDVAIIRRNVELEARLIDDLLDMTRIGAGKVELRPEVIDIHAAIRQTLDICKADITAKQLEVNVELSAERHAVSADPARLQQVLWNLLKNAVKFTPQHGHIWLRTQDAGGVGEQRMRIEVADSGRGIEADLLPRMFNAFEQGDKSTTRRFGGLGLGLTISKAIVDMHGGTLTAASQGRGKGATFTIELTTTTAALTTPGFKASQPSAGAPLTVLFVEDHEDTRRIMAKVLHASGYIVRTAGGVKDALSILDSEHVDVLISDLGLPDGSGYDIMERIRDRGTPKGIALSGYGMEEDIRHSEQSGFSRHLTKPIQPRELDQVIRQVLTM